ncbi:MAG: hypothetical protein ACRDG4_03230 [Chloroflexota bacterium]
MSRRSRNRSLRLQRIIAVILLVALAGSGMAFFAASTNTPTQVPPTNQGR